jgi:hypothetical protein
MMTDVLTSYDAPDAKSIPRRAIKPGSTGQKLVAQVIRCTGHKAAGMSVRVGLEIMIEANTPIDPPGD